MRRDLKEKFYDPAGNECIAVFGKGREITPMELAVIQAGLTREQINKAAATAAELLARLDPNNPDAPEIIAGVAALTAALKIAKDALADDESETAEIH